MPRLCAGPRRYRDGRSPGREAPVRVRGGDFTARGGGCSYGGCVRGRTIGGNRAVSHEALGVFNALVITTVYARVQII
jgi:hypothetical protein